MSVIRLSLCTNDPDNGNDTGRVSAIHVGCSLELARGELGGTDPRYRLLPPNLREHFRRLAFSRRIFPILGSREWEGNWCWTGIAMSPKVAADFLNYVAKDDRWHIEGGWCELSDLFDEGKLTAAWIEEHAEELEQG